MGNNTQPFGTVKISPSADRTVFEVGPGVKVRSSALNVVLHNPPSAQPTNLMSFATTKMLRNHLQFSIHHHFFHP